MVSSKSIRTGILFAIAAAMATSCGETTFTQPNPKNEIVAVGTFEQFLNSPQQESRELLIDGRVTDIEWNIAGEPSIILLEGDGGRGSYYVSLRALWTLDRFARPDGILFVLQWPDRTENRLEEPLVTSADVLSAAGDTLINCRLGDDTLVRESSWRRSTSQEDEVSIELYSDSLGSYPADVWRWGAETTDAVTPVSCTEFIGACTDGDDFGSTTHPGAAFMEDFYDVGGGPVRDVGKWTYMLANHNPGSNVPLKIASKGTRDTRLNRGKPTTYVLWETVSKAFGRCEYQNPIREDDASFRDKTWNPGDYVPSFRSSFPDSSQRDVLAKGAWLAGKWALEVRRDLTAAPPDSAGIPQPPRPDDVRLTPGRRYLIRVTIVDGATRSSSRSSLIPVYLRP